MSAYAGQLMSNGAQAETYADHFIAVHLKEIGGGKTYSQLSAESLAQPKNTALAEQVRTLFRAEVGEVGIGVREQVVRDDEQGVADGDQRALLAAAAGDPVVAGAEEGLGPGGADACLAEGAAEPGVALARSARFSLAGALPGPGRELGP
jgi:hypothetical protein